MCYKGGTSRRSNSNVLQNQGETRIMFPTISSGLNLLSSLTAKDLSNDICLICNNINIYIVDTTQ